MIRDLVILASVIATWVGFFVLGKHLVAILMNWLKSRGGSKSVLVFALWAAGLGVVCALACEIVSAKETKKGHHPDAAFDVGAHPRQIELGEDAIARIYTAPGYATLLQLPPSEEIRQFGVGDSRRWVVTCGVTPAGDAGGKNLCGIKPAHSGETTNLHVISTGGRIYSFRLAPADATHPVDLMVFIQRDPRKLIASLDPGAAGDSAPRADLLACTEGERTAKANAADLSKSLDEAKGRIAALVDPHSVEFDYKLSGRLFSKSSVVMFHDGRRTFLLQASDSAEVYRAKDEPVPAQCANRLCVVDGILDRGYFVAGIGKSKVKFQRRRKESHHA